LQDIGVVAHALRHGVQDRFMFPARDAPPILVAGALRFEQTGATGGGFVTALGPASALGTTRRLNSVQLGRLKLLATSVMRNKQP